MSTPPGPGSIVVGVDGSPSAQDAVRWAADQARLEQRTLTLVHGVAMTLTGAVGEPGFEVRQVMEAAEVRGRRLLEDTRERLGEEGLRVSQVFELLDPRTLLVDLSADAAMLVLGSRGRGPVASLLLGSVSVAVVAHAQCPVVVMRPGGSQDPRDSLHPAGPPVVVSLSAASPVTRAVEFAFAQASLRSLPLVLLHGTWDPLAGPDGRIPVGLPRNELGETEQLLRRELRVLLEKYPEVPVGYHLREGLPDDCLVAASRDAAMVVVGTRHPGLGTSLLEGNIARSVTEHAHCPVAVVPA